MLLINLYVLTLNLLIISLLSRYYLHCLHYLWTYCSVKWINSDNTCKNVCNKRACYTRYVIIYATCAQELILTALLVASIILIFKCDIYDLHVGLAVTCQLAYTSLCERNFVRFFILHEELILFCTKKHGSSFETAYMRFLYLLKFNREPVDPAVRFLSFIPIYTTGS